MEPEGLSTHKCFKRLAVYRLRLCFAINAKMCHFFDYHLKRTGEGAENRVLGLPLPGREYFS